MSIRVELLSKNRYIEYEKFLFNNSDSLLYSSLKFKYFLQKVLKDSKSYYLLAYNNHTLVGVLPSFLISNETSGNVLNSLPFYGSNGGLILSKSTEYNIHNTQYQLLNAFNEIASSKSAVSSTIISNPLFDSSFFYENHAVYTYRDERIGQITELPVMHSEKEWHSNIFSKLHKKTRNSIRKAEKSELLVYHSGSLSTIEVLAKLHQENMLAIGGLPKSLDILMAIRDIFSYGDDYRIYIAEKNHVPVAALLVFFYNKTAEYYIPATRSDYRVLQPMSLLIYHAMKDASLFNCYYWNWGGTWSSQKGVYTFKKRWGTIDNHYYYYTNILNERILYHDKSELLFNYPYYYVAPFSKLKPT